MADPAVAEAIGSTTQADPSSVGAKPSAQAYAEVHPPTSPAPEEPTGGTPGEVPGAAAPERPEADDWKKDLPPDVAKRVDQVITDLRQKDTQKTRDLEGQLQKLGWAEELSRLTSSENPAERQRAAQLIRATLQVIEQGTPQAAPDPLAGVDWQTVETIMPGLGKAIQHLSAQNADLRQQITKTGATVESTAYRAAEQAFGIEARELEDWAKSKGLPFDLKKVVETENRLGIADLRAAYFATYGEDMIGAGAKAAQTSLERKKAASLPGGSAGAGTPQRPKFASMHDAWEYNKRAAGISGPVEYKG